MTAHAQMQLLDRERQEINKLIIVHSLEKLELGKMETALSKAIIKTSNNADPCWFLSTPFVWPP